MEDVQIYQAIDAELSRQEVLKKQGKFANTCEDLALQGNYSDIVSVITEELGEFAKDTNENKRPIELRDELVQIAACSISALRGL